MAGSWEILNANQVLIPTLHTDITTVAWTYGIRNLLVPGREELRQFSPFLPLSGMPFDHARNSSVLKMLELGANYLFSIDSDVIPPRDALLRLMSYRVPVISGLYCRRSPPHMVPVAIRNGSWLNNFQVGQIVEVDLVGAGCLLIHRSVFEALPPNPKRPEKRWFDWRVDAAGLFPQGEALSEDFSLCLRIRRELGIKVLVDTGCLCRHAGFFESTLGQANPLNCTPIT